MRLLLTCGLPAVSAAAVKGNRRGLFNFDIGCPLWAGKRIAFSFPLLLLITSARFSACSNDKHADRKPIEPPPISKDSPVDLRPPQLTEVQEKIKMIYGQTLIVESVSGQSFFSGDFNGDTWPDLAVIAKPSAGSLAELNHELANWTL